MVLYSVLLCALLVVQCDSYLVDTPRNVVVMTGASVTLPCKTSGGQSITWLAQDGSVISKGTTVATPSKYSVDNSESGRYNLVIKSAIFGLGGTYQCQQTDDADSRYYAEVTVLDGTPRITSNGPDGNNIMVNETMELTCSIPCQGNMLPTFVWSPAEYSCSCSIRTASRSTSTLAQNFIYITYQYMPSYYSQPSFSCLVFFDRVNVTDSVRARNAPSYTPVQLSYTVNVQVPVVKASLSASTFGSDGIMYTGSAIECQGSGNMLNYMGYNILPAPTYTWQVSTISTDLQFGPMSSRYLTATQDMIGRTTFTCTASNTIRGVTYSATSDPLTVIIMKDDRFDGFTTTTMSSTSDQTIGDTTTSYPFTTTIGDTTKSSTSNNIISAYYSSSKTSAQTRGTTLTRVTCVILALSALIISLSL